MEINTYCDCACHVHAEISPDHQCFPVCAPCAFCRQPIRILFLREHQEACPQRLALAPVEQRTALKLAAAAP
jgi:hypothetical protein